MKTKRIICNLILILLLGSVYTQAQDILYISADSLEKKHVLISGNWYYHPGDDSLWAQKEYNHSEWDTVLAFMDVEKFNIDKWTGAGWFRKVVQIDSSLLNTTVGLQVHHEGASEFYLNGKRVIKFGNVSQSADEEISEDPQYFPYTISFDSSLVNTIAVRYSNQAVIEHKYIYRKFFGHIGFSVWLFNINSKIEEIIDTDKIFTMFQFGTIGFSLTLAIVFFLLYFFYSNKRENLFFALFTFGVFMVLLPLQLEYVFRHNLLLIAILRLVTFSGFSLIFIYLLLFIYHVVYNRIIKPFWILLTLFFIVNLVSFFGSADVFSTFIPVLITGAISSVESIRVLIVGIKQKTTYIKVIAAGISVFLLMIFCVFLLQFFDARPPDFVFSLLFMTMFVSVPLSMAIYLAKSFRKTNIDLEEKIETVQRLSAEQIAQEQINADLRIQAEIERAENERKSNELEEARQMQLSMLPQNLPDIASLDIAVYMKTATEVGGDYYDFSYRDDGSINIALGDATGHGMKAGIMVSAMKSIFTTNSKEMELDTFFKTANDGIKNMNLKRMMMGLKMINIMKNQFKLINAGMPPVLLYKKTSKAVEEIQEHGVPIRAMNYVQYNTTDGKLEKGDVLLLISDGMPELHNDKHEMYGYDRIKDLLGEVNGYKSEEIITQLKEEASAWANDQDPDDDVTFVVIKVK